MVFWVFYPWRGWPCVSEWGTLKIHDSGHNRTLCLVLPSIRKGEQESEGHSISQKQLDDHDNDDGYGIDEKMVVGVRAEEGPRCSLLCIRLTWAPPLSSGTSLLCTSTSAKNWTPVMSEHPHFNLVYLWGSSIRVYVMCAILYCVHCTLYKLRSLNIT